MLTAKDLKFLKELKKLIDSKELHVELRAGSPARMVLKGTYGKYIHKTFGVTRQGVRWRFQHIFGNEYVKAFESILFIEKIFGTELRDYAIKISRQRYQLRKEDKKF